MSKSNRISMAVVYGLIWYLLMYFPLVFLSEQVSLKPAHYLFALFAVLSFSILYQSCCYHYQWYHSSLRGFVQALGLSLILYFGKIMGQTIFPYYCFFLNTWLYFQATVLSFKTFSQSQNIE